MELKTNNFFIACVAKKPCAGWVQCKLILICVMQGFGFFNQISDWFNILRKGSSVGMTVE